MLLGKRPRHQIKRTTSMTEFAFDASKPSPVEFAVSPPPSDEPTAVPLPESFLDQSATVAALVSPRVTQRRYSAEYGLSAAPAASASQFLKSCSLCKRRFIPGRDIYMYRGDSAFCSLECRQQKMNQDERKERAARKTPTPTPPLTTTPSGRAAKVGEGGA